MYRCRSVSSRARSRLLLKRFTLGRAPGSVPRAASPAPRSPAPTTARAHLADVAGEEHGPEAVPVPERLQALGEQAGGGGVVGGLSTEGQRGTGSGAVWDWQARWLRGTAALTSGAHVGPGGTALAGPPPTRVLRASTDRTAWGQDIGFLASTPAPRLLLGPLGLDRWTLRRQQPAGTWPPCQRPPGPTQAPGLISCNQARGLRAAPTH